ncbi:TniQ family protein [Undibacterium sp. KW1]|uniref:TniQ family protein n=1 Tax=Undibacterium sp. KW1 TaxID=2058624 RepID=UPI0013895F19|nr:TniQ family protein [Undibacterium sp. KW1]
MKGITESLWPIHYKPLPDELLSCWLVRLAHGHGLKVQTFCNLIFGNQRQIWNRDMDRLAPTWLIDELSQRTATPPETTWNTTLHSYEGLLYRKFKASGALQWILALKVYHRKREGYGLQYCPTCLAEDSIPYYRKRWRIAFYTVCTKHHTMMLDRCPQCAAGVAFHRLDIANGDAIEAGSLAFCHECGFDLREASAVEPLSYDSDATALLLNACNVFDLDQDCDYKWDLGRYSVLHQLSMILTSKYRHVSLRNFVLDQLGCRDIPLTAGRVSFEMRSIEERHHLLQLAMWLMVLPDVRLEQAWRTGTVRYNVLLKDFSEPPDWYSFVTAQFKNWRRRFQK